MADDDDGVNRGCLEYRAGWVECLQAFSQRLGIENVRAKKSERNGLTAAARIAKEMYDAMIAKMRGGS